MSEQASDSNNRLTLQHLQEVDIDTTELVALVTLWLSSHEHLWRTAPHAGLEEVPQDAAGKLNAETVSSFGQKI